MSAIEDWFNDLDYFGTNAAARAKAQQAQANEQRNAAITGLNAQTATANTQATQNAAQAATQQNMSNVSQADARTQQANAADWINTGGQSGQIASRGASDIAGVSGGTARSMGMNAAQAAKQGGQAGSGAYGELQRNAQAQGIQGYTNLAGQSFGSAASQGANANNAYSNANAATANANTSAMGAGNLASGSAAQAAQQNTQASAQGSGAISGLVSTATSLIGSAGSAGSAGSGTSDERAKKNIKASHDVVNAVFSKVNPKTFQYKDNGPGADGGKPHVGVMAQDLEKTPLKGAVINTPEGKKVDVWQLTAGNTAMIGELNAKLEKIMKYVKGMK